MRVHSSLQKYENEDIVMCNICLVISFEGCYLCSKGRQIYESEIYKLIFSPVFIRHSSEFIP